MPGGAAQESDAGGSLSSCSRQNHAWLLDIPAAASKGNGIVSQSMAQTCNVGKWRSSRRGVASARSVRKDLITDVFFIVFCSTFLVLVGASVSNLNPLAGNGKLSRAAGGILSGPPACLPRARQAIPCFTQSVGPLAGFGQKVMVDRLASRSARSTLPRSPFGSRSRKRGVFLMIGLRPTSKNIDYYAVLGLNRGATLQEIKAAYKMLALKNHPDVSKEPEAAAKFALINEAYSTLSDNEKQRQNAIRLQSMPSRPMRNTKHFKLGEVVVHKKENYICVVVGIDEVCGAGEDWIMAQLIDKLPRGRNQRFYHVLPDLPNDGATLDDAAQVLCSCPAFLTKLTTEDEWPTLQTAYVPEDLLIQFIHTNFQGSEGPVHNPLVQQYFMEYRRGRYAHDGVSLQNMKFYPVAEALTFCMLYGSCAVENTDGSEE